MAENAHKDPEELTITLTAENGVQVECLVIALFEAGGQGYAVLLPDLPEAREAGELFFYRYEEDDNGKPELGPILTEDEFRMVTDIFREIMEQKQ